MDAKSQSQGGIIKKRVHVEIIVCVPKFKKFRGSNKEGSDGQEVG